MPARVKKGDEVMCIAGKDKGRTGTVLEVLPQEDRVLVMPKAAIPIMFLISSLCQALLTAPLAKLSGQAVRNRNQLLLAGFGVMVACDAVFALPAFASSAGMFFGAGLLGLGYAAGKGQLQLPPLFTAKASMGR